jgi:hypothetical protein
MFKYVILSFVAIAILNGADRSGCSEEQIAKLIINNISDAAIDSSCKPKVTKETKTTKATSSVNDKQIVININNNSNANVKDSGNSNNTNNLSGSSSLIKNSNKDKDYFYWRIGVSNISTGDSFNEAGVSVGLHFYPDGLVDNSIGFGISYASAHRTSRIDNHEKDDDTIYIWNQPIEEELTIGTITYELIYNKLLGKSIIISPMIFTSNTNYQTKKKYNYGQRNSNSNTYSGSGAGVYLTLAKPLDRGYSFSAYYKRVSISDEDIKSSYKTINMFGLEFIW